MISRYELSFLVKLYFEYSAGSADKHCDTHHVFNLFKRTEQEIKPTFKGRSRSVTVAYKIDVSYDFKL
jgi:hypothetical protein